MHLVRKPENGLWCVSVLKELYLKFRLEELTECTKHGSEFHGFGPAAKNTQGPNEVFMQGTAMVKVSVDLVQ